MYIGSIHESIEDGHIVPNMYTVNFVVANDIEPQFVNTNLSDFGVLRGREMMTYSLDELRVLARQLDVSFESETPESMFNALGGIAIDANIKDSTDGSQERLFYRVNVEDAIRSDLEINHVQHFENTEMLENEFLSMTMDGGSVASSIASMSDDVYDGPDAINDMESLFYAERALNKGDYEYADVRPYEIINRLKDKIEVHNSDRTVYNLFFKNEMKQFNINGGLSKSIDEEFGEIPTYDSIDDVEHDPFASLDIDYENAPPIENLLIGIDEPYAEVELTELRMPDELSTDLNVESELETNNAIGTEKDEDGLFVETGEVDTSDRKGKRVFIDGVPQKVQTETTGGYRYNIPLSLANDKLSPMDAYVKPKLNTANQWYNQREMDRVANATHVPVDYKMDDFDKKALESDLVRTKKGEYRLDTNTLKAVSDFDYDKHIETTKEVQSVYALWKEALSSTGKALNATAKDTMFRAYRLTEKFGEWRNNLKEEYAKWSVVKEEELDSTKKTPLKEKMREWKTSMSDWTRGRTTGYMSESKTLSRVERANWIKAQSIMSRLGFGKKDKVVKTVEHEKSSDKEFELE